MCTCDDNWLSCSLQIVINYRDYVNAIARYLYFIINLNVEMICIKVPFFCLRGYIYIFIISIDRKIERVFLNDKNKNL